MISDHINFPVRFEAEYFILDRKGDPVVVLGAAPTQRKVNKIIGPWIAQVMNDAYDATQRIVFGPGMSDDDICRVASDEYDLTLSDDDVNSVLHEVIAECKHATDVEYCNYAIDRIIRDNFADRISPEHL